MLGVAPVNIRVINLQVNTPIAMGGRNTRELTGHAQCHTSLLATSSLGDGSWLLTDRG